MADARLRPEPGVTALLDTRLWAIRNELKAAVVQMQPSDDQIICGHVRQALQLIEAELGVK